MKLIKNVIKITILLFLTSCTKQTTKSSELNSIFEKSLQSFEVAHNDSIVGEEGTIIFINPKDLITESGKPVKGAIDVELKEYYKKADILGTNLSTCSKGRLLETGGMIEVNAFKDKQKLKLKNSASIKIKFPTNELKEGMELFNGEIKKGTVDWISNRKPEINGAGFFVQEDTYREFVERDEVKYRMSNYYLLESTKLGWINCDRFYDEKNVTDIYVKADTIGNPIVSLVFMEINSIMPGHYYKDKYVFNRIPTGSIVYCIGIKKVSNKFYYAHKTFKVKSNMEFELNFNELSEKELKAKINSLN